MNNPKLMRLKMQGGLRPLMPALNQAPWFDLTVAIKGIVIIQTQLDLVKHILKLTDQYVSEHYVEASAEVKARWREDWSFVKRMFDHDLGVQDDEEGINITTVLGKLYTVIEQQIGREDGHYHITQETMLHYWNEAVDLAKAYIVQVEAGVPA